MFFTLLRLSLQVEIHPKEDLLIKFDGNEANNKKYFNMYGGKFQHNQIDENRKVVSLTWNSGKSGTGGAANLESKQLYTFGRYTARFKSPDTRNQPNAGLISSFFLYNGLTNGRDIDGDGKDDGADLNGNGIKDHAELDFEFLNAAPTEVYITSHYDLGKEGHQAVTRTVDLEKGTSISCIHIDSRKGKKTNYTKFENQPEVPKIPGYRNYNYNTFVIDYMETGCKFWIEVNGERKLLADVPKKFTPYSPVFIIANIWWSDNWTPNKNKNAIEKPDPTKIDPTMKYEWIKYEPFKEPTPAPTPKTPSPTKNTPAPTPKTPIIVTSSISELISSPETTQEGNEGPQNADQGLYNNNNFMNTGLTLVQFCIFIVLGLIALIILVIIIAYCVHNRKHEESSSADEDGIANQALLV